jgi:hypothetical protein
MKKRILVVIMVVALLMVSSISVFAAVGDVDPVAVEALVDEANEDIDNLVDEAKIAADAEGLSNKDLMEIIVELKKETREISKSAIKDARDMGCNDIHCYFIEIEIGDKLVKVDPLVVGGW